MTGTFAFDALITKLTFDKRRLFQNRSEKQREKYYYTKTFWYIKIYQYIKKCRKSDNKENVFCTATESWTYCRRGGMGYLYVKI